MPQNLSKTKSFKSGVSAVVCCYNSSKIIVLTIESLSRQEIPASVGFEVILVGKQLHRQNRPIGKRDMGKSLLSAEDYKREGTRFNLCQESRGEQRQV